MRRTVMLALALAGLAADWASYNGDAQGTRHNAAEKHLGRDNVSRLVEKWKFTTLTGPIHMTPVVVNGHVYFGTAGFLPTFFKLTPQGKVRWSYRNPGAGKLSKDRPARSGVPDAGFLTSPLVTTDTVYVGDVGGYFYALDRATGKERWKVDTRNPRSFRGGHSSNCIFASPILADGKIILAGGGYEHGLALDPQHQCCTGRGFVAALEPATGNVVWKYDVGPEPKPLDPPVRIRDAWGEHVFRFGPSTSSVWSTPSYDPETKAIYFGTDTHNAPRQPTRDDPRLYTKHSCAIIAVDAATGRERWVTQINPGDVWNYAMRAYDPTTGLYKDQSIGDTPKPFTIQRDDKPVRVVGAGCKNGAFYVLDTRDGTIVAQTPVYRGPPRAVPDPAPHPRTLALPGPIGGLQTGCATDGQAIYTNGTDCMLMATSVDQTKRFHPPTGGRVVSLSMDLAEERWRHERPRVKAVGGTAEKPAFTNVGDPVASGIALANGVAFFTTTVSNKLVALDTATGRTLREIDLGPVWCGPSVSRGRVYVGTGNILFAPFDASEAYFPKRYLSGSLVCFGLPGKDEVDGLKPE
ncbi:MAG: PQQ-binding-like beta-propeller repeat protein [Gemmataceae bacterium]